MEWSIFSELFMLELCYKSKKMSEVKYLITNIDRIVNTDLDFSHYLGLLCHNEEGKIIAQIKEACGNELFVKIKGDASAKTVQGEVVKSSYDLFKYIRDGRKGDIIYNSECYLEVSGRKDELEYIGVYFSLGDMLQDFT